MPPKKQKMSATVSGTYRQSKGSGAGKSPSGKRKAPPPAVGLREQGEEAEDSEAQRLLHVFDLTSKFGPCTGITRLARWERAHRLGLNPPQAVKDLLEAAEGEERERLNRGIWEGRGI